MPDGFVSERAEGIGRKVTRAKLTIEGALGGGLEGGLDLLVGSRLREAAGKVDNGDVGGGDAEGHAGELAVELGNDLADSLGGASAGGDDVLGRSAAAAPVLAGGAVDGLLGGGVGVDGGHETLNDAEVVVDDLGEGSQAVGGARGVGDDGGLAVVGLIVDTHHVHGGIGRGGRDDDALGAALEMGAGLLGSGEDTGRLDDVLGAGRAPGDGSGVALSVELDVLAVDNQAVGGDLDGALELAVGRVVAEHVLLQQGCEGGVSSDRDRCQGGGICMGARAVGGDNTHSILGLNEGVVDGDNLDLRVLDGIAEDDAADTAEPVDANLDGHFVCEVDV